MSISKLKLDTCQPTMNIVDFVVYSTQSVCFVTRQFSQLFLLWTDVLPVLTSLPKFDRLVCFRFELDYKATKLHFVKVQVSVSIFTDLAQKIENLIFIAKEGKHNSGRMKTVESIEWNFYFGAFKLLLFTFLLRQYLSQFSLSFHPSLRLFLFKLQAILFLLLLG